MTAEIRRLELHLSYACVQTCGFCSESERMARFERSPVTPLEIAGVLARKRAQGFEHVTFTGGEPTLHPHFLGTVRAARKLGYRVCVTSNGSRLAAPSFARAALPWIDELCLSVHGDGARLHDAMTAAPGSHERVRRALENAAAQGPGVFLMTNTVVTEANFPALERILQRLLEAPGPRHCLFSNLAPEGRGAEAYGARAAPLRAWKAVAPSLAARAAGRGVTARFFGLPLCALGSAARYSNDLYFSPRATVERSSAGGRVTLSEIVSVNPTRKRIKTGRCGGCAASQACGGVFAAYAAIHGDAELEPLREAVHAR